MGLFFMGVEKKSEKIFGTHMEKIYHIYAKGRCLYHSLPEEKFKEIWETIHRLIDLIDAPVRKEELSFEEVTVNRELSRNSSY